MSPTHDVVAPATLPIQPVQPEPILRMNAYFIVNGIPVQVVGERWPKGGEPSDLGSVVVPDPSNPAIALTIRLQSPGAVIRSISRDEFRRASRRPRGAGRSRTGR